VVMHTTSRPLPCRICLTCMTALLLFRALGPQNGLRTKAQNRPAFPGTWKDAAPGPEGWQAAFVAALQRIRPSVPGKIRPIAPFTGQ
jgi:hypothetical protein